MYLTKEQQHNIVQRWAKSEDTQLFHVYKSFSSDKLEAFKYCRDKMCDLNGWGMRIISHNTFQFTVGFLYRRGENQQLYFYYITKNHQETWEVKSEW